MVEFHEDVIAATALALARDNLVQLDSTLRGRAFTLRQLLRHQAGLTDYGQLSAYHAAVAGSEEPWTEDEMLARADADVLRYQPGEGWSYSNVGYLYVRRLIEDVLKESIASALERLVLSPLGITGARFVGSRSDLAGVRMGEQTNYDPRWVYHGLLVGPLRDAALLLDRLLTGQLLPPELMRAMLEGHRLGGPIPGRPWVAPGYGLGLMIGAVASGAQYAGHTGGGPGSVIAVYHRITGAPVTSATFALGGDQGLVEDEAVDLIP